MALLDVVVFLLLPVSTIAQKPTRTQLRHQAITGITNHTQDQAHLPPDYETTDPTLVTVGLYINSFNVISDSNMDYELTLNLKMSWTDTRLNYSAIPGHDRLELEPAIIEKLWFPDIYFINAKKARFHYVTVPNTMVHLYPDGKVFANMKVTTVLRCDMDLRKFPFDTQTCAIEIVSYSYTTNDVTLQWFEPPLEFQPDLRLPRFYLTDHTADKCLIDTPGSDEKQSCLIATVDLERAYGYFLTEIYIPSTLVVILSWVTFWLDVEAVPARITLGLLTVLTMTTQGANSGSTLPKISSIKAIDVWVATCLFFVFAALMEFAYVNVKARLEDWFMFCGRVHYESLQDLIGSIAGSEYLDETNTVHLLHHHHHHHHHTYDNEPTPVTTTKQAETIPDTETQDKPAVPVRLSTSVDDGTDGKESVPEDSTSLTGQKKSIAKKESTAKKESIAKKESTAKKDLDSKEENQGNTNSQSRASEVDLLNVVQPGAVNAESITSLEIDSLQKTMDQLMEVEDETALERARHIDRISRIAFPVLFGIFNILYWSTYLNWEIKQVADTDQS